MSTSTSLEFIRPAKTHKLPLKIKGGVYKCSYNMKSNILQICYKTFSGPNKQVKRTKDNYWKQKVEKFCHHYQTSLLSIRITTMDFQGYGNTLAKEKREIINSLLHKKLLISNPFVISFLHVCFYVQYPIFCPFLAGGIKANNPLMHQTDVFVFKAKWNLMNFCALPLRRRCQKC